MFGVHHKIGLRIARLLAASLGLAAQAACAGVGPPGQSYVQSHDTLNGPASHRIVQFAAHISARRGFTSHQRDYLHDYYRDQIHRGTCPPGLLKQHGACVPSGQPRRWRLGHPLTGVTYYDLTPPISMNMGMPPPGYRYVRVGPDILMIATGTGIVVDAVTGLSQM